MRMARGCKQAKMGDARMNLKREKQTKRKRQKHGQQGKPGKSCAKFLLGWDRPLQTGYLGHEFAFAFGWDPSAVPLALLCCHAWLVAIAARGLRTWGQHVDGCCCNSNATNGIIGLPWFSMVWPCLPAWHFMVHRLGGAFSRNL